MVSGTNNQLLGALMRVEAIVISAMKWSLILGMASMVLVVFLQIISRYLLSMSLGWSEEVARLLFICIVFIGSALLAKTRGHLTVTVLVDLLPIRIRHLSVAFASLVGLVCSRFLVEGAWATFAREWDQRTPALQFPMGVIFAIILLSMVFLAIWLAVTLVVSLQKAWLGTD